MRCHDDIGWAIDDCDAYAAGSTAPGTGDSSPTGTPATSPARGPTAWSSSTTPRPATSASAGPPHPWPAYEGRRPRREQRLARLFLAHAIAPAGAASRSSGAATSSASPTTPTGGRGRTRGRQPLGAPAAARLVAGRSAARPQTVPGRVFSGLAHLARVRAGLPQLHASAPTTVLQDTDDGVLAVVRHHASGALRRPLQRDRHAAPVPPTTAPRRHGMTTPYDALGGTCSRSAATA